MKHPFVGLVIVAVAITLGAGSAPAGAEKTTGVLVPLSEIHDRQILVELATVSTSKSVSAFCTSKQLSLVRTMPLSYTTYQIIRVPEDQDYHQVLANLQNDPQVKAVGPNVIKYTSEVIPEVIPNDPLFFNGATDSETAIQSPAAKNNQYSLILTGAHRAWDVTTGNPNVIVAVLDTGSRFTHEDLTNRFWVNPGEIPGNGIDDDSNGYIDDINGYDFEGWTVASGVGGDNNPEDPTTLPGSHGTSTSSIIGAEGNNGLGITGVAGGDSPETGIRLMICRVGTNTSITVDAEIGAIDYAISNGARVISMSFGGVSGGPIEEDAINRAWDAGVFVVAASGNVGLGNQSNDGGDTVWLVDLPAGFDNCVAVGATTIFSSQSVSGSTQVVDEVEAIYSKGGPELDFAAPGTHIMACTNGDDSYSDRINMQFTGTSAATPLVAGLAALIYSKDYDEDGDIDLTPDDVKNIMIDSALDLGPAGFDNQYGYGRIQMDIALGLELPAPKNGDANDDGVVDLADVQVIIDKFGARLGDPNYTLAADTNHDNVIDELDLLEVARNFE